MRQAVGVLPAGGDSEAKTLIIPRSPTQIIYKYHEMVQPDRRSALLLFHTLTSSPRLISTHYSISLLESGNSRPGLLFSGQGILHYLREIRVPHKLRRFPDVSRI